MYGTEAMPRTAENLAEKYNISRERPRFFCSVVTTKGRSGTK